MHGYIGILATVHFVFLCYSITNNKRGCYARAQTSTKLIKVEQIKEMMNFWKKLNVFNDLL